MPKKTKKEKIIAEYRHKLSTIHEKVPSPSLYAYQAKFSASVQVVAAPQPMDRLVRRDLVKTLILAAVAIGGEVVLSRILPS